MKRILCLSLMIFSFLCFTACSMNKGEPIEKNDTTFLVKFVLETNEDVYGIGYSYFLSDTLIGNGACQNANEKAFNEKTVVIDFTAQDFSEKEDLSNFKLDVLIRDKDGYEYKCKESIEWDASYDEEYTIVLSGNYATGFTATMEQ